ncbi:MAG TPA: peptidylprolyl isomerase [Ignavibacteriaceae bacterium]|nr:peptidylprolyl isomerase [Ignavibacteriaceae bacterium]
MPMMARMRSLAPAFIISVGALFVLFMVISDSNVLQALGGKTNYIGKVNGEDITYQEFNNVFEKQREQLTKQNGGDLTEEKTIQLRDQVWDAMVTQILVKQQIDKLGITVSDQEVKNIILGDNPPDFLKQNFIDSTGKFNREAYESALYNPQNKNVLIQAEDGVRQNRLNEKLQSLIFASVTVSEDELKRDYIDKNTKITADYVLAPLFLFPDSLFTVSDAELKDYYNNNLDKYKVSAQRKVKFVMFPFKASSEDSAFSKKNLEIIKDKFSQDTASFKSVVENYSSTPVTVDTMKISQFPGEITGKIENAATGSVLGPLVTTEGYTLFHLIGSVKDDNPEVRASHILINQYGNDEQNKAEAMKIYNQLKSGADFGKMAKDYSKDPGSAQKEGDLGWFGKGMMVPEFEKAAFNAPVGVIQEPVKTQFGYHIIKVTGKSEKKYIVEKIINPLEVSATTKDLLMNSAQDFSFIAKKDGFESEAKLMNYEVKESGAFMKDASSIPALGTNKNIVDFAFDNSLNTISDPFRLNQGYTVVMVSDITNEGVRSFDEVKNTIRPQVVREKQYAKSKQLVEDIRKKIDGDLSKASTINPKVTFNEAKDFTPAGTVPGIGKDWAFIETALNVPVNKISDPVKGNRGYYLIKVTQRTPFDSTAYEIQRNTLRDNLIRQKQSTVLTEWLAQLKKQADIVDNRKQFFGQ